MKILQVVHGFPPENVAGTEIYTYNLAKELARNHEVFVFYRTTDFSKKEYELSFHEREGLNLFSINNTFRDYSSFESTYKDEKVAEKFSQVLDQIKPDIIHVQHLLYLSARVIEEAKKRNIPVVFTLNDYWLLCPQGQLFRNNKIVCGGHETTECAECILYQLGIRKNISFLYAVLRKFTPGWFFQMAKNLYLGYAKLVYLNDAQAKKFVDDRIRFMKDIFSQVDLFIAPSKFMKEKFVKFGIPEEKIEFFPYGFDLKRVEKRPKTPSSVLRFGFIGNLMPAKGVHVLLKGFLGLPAGAAELRIYGKAFSYKSALGNYVGQLKKMVKGNAIKFMGDFNKFEIGKVLADIDVLVVPSLWYENAPLVIQEALLSQTPVIAARIGGIPELVTDGVNGFLFEPGNEQDLKEKMEFFTRRPTLLNELKKEAFKVRGIEAHAKEIDLLYRRQVSRDSRGNKGGGSSGVLGEINRNLMPRGAVFIRNVAFFFLFALISLVPLPLQHLYSLQLKICFLAGLIFSLRWSKQRVFRRSDWPLWLFLAAMSFGVFGVASPKLAVRTFLDLSLPMLFIYFFIAENFSSKKNFSFLARVICVFSIVVAFWGFLDCLWGVNFLYEDFFKSPFYDRYLHGFPMRALATQFHAPPLGTYLIASLPFSWLLMKHERSIYRVLGIVGTILAVTVSILTFSRGVFLSLAVMIFCLLFFQKRKRMMLALFVGIVAFVCFAPYFPYPFAKFGFSAIFSAGDGIFTPYRFERLQMLWNILKEHPFFGIGFQHVRLLFHNYYPVQGFESYEFMIMDNMYLTIAAETGIVGITAFFIFIGSVILKAWRKLEEAKEDAIQRTRLAYVLIGFLGLLVNAMAYELFYWPSQYMFFCIYIALIEALHRDALLRTDRSVSAGSLLRQGDAVLPSHSVSVIVPTCGYGGFFVSCLEALRRQTHPPAEVILVNNALNVELERKARELYPSIKIITPDRNLYYGESLNQGIAMSTGRFILCLNDDAMLDEDFIHEALKGFHGHEEVGMVSGKVLRLNGRTLDTTGLFLSICRTGHERGHGRLDRGQFDRPGFIFGVGGAVAFYRRKMLEEIKEGDKFFDPSFRMFYEDLDLSWRAHNRGWKAYYVPTALAHHVRGGSVRCESGQGKPLARRYLSDEFHADLIKNRYRAIKKNETFGAFCLHLIPIMLYDLCAWGYVLFFRPRVLKGVFSSLR